MGKKTLYMVAEIPDELEQPFLKYVRAFDLANDGCHFVVSQNVPGEEFATTMERVKQAGEKLGLPVFGFVRDK
jgi:hypothetical protein